MILAADLRKYHESLAIYCLASAGSCSASELVEQMGAASMAAAHPPECWRPLSPPMVSGLLREMAGRHLVERLPSRRNARYGRQEAMWGLGIGAGPAESRRTQLPAVPTTTGAPLAAAPAPAVPTEPRGLSRAQRLGLLQIEFEEMQLRMRNEWDTFQARARRVLELEGEAA